MKTVKVMLVIIDEVWMLVTNNEIGNKDITIYATDKKDDKLDINPAFVLSNKIGSEHLINVINNKPVPASNGYIYTMEIGDELPSLDKDWNEIIGEALKDKPNVNNYYTCLVRHLKNKYNPPTKL